MGTPFSRSAFRGTVVPAISPPLGREGLAATPLPWELIHEIYLLYEGLGTTQNP